MINAIWWILGAGIVLFFLLRQGAGGEGALSPSETNAYIASQKDLQVVDVRTPEEFTEGHLAQAVNIPLDQLQASLRKISKEKPILLYCHSGRRSAAALKILRKNGCTQAKHLKGGLSAWQNAGFPVLK
jgi:hydroxyacylglutathione hydrolase